MRIGAFARGRYWRARRRLDEFGARARALTRLAKLPAARARMALDPQPLSEFWGHDRGTPIHRYYLAQFLQQHAADIQGHCLEFQEDSYTSRFGGERISKLDILHIDASNPNATIIADLTRPNAVPSDTFDCIVCTHVLHLVGEVDALVRDLHRILKPGGVMLVASPQIGMLQPEHAHESWRCFYTPDGLRWLLAKAFGASSINIRSYGNSLVAGAELRGVVTSELTVEELDFHDPRFAVEVCARVMK